MLIETNKIRNKLLDLSEELSSFDSAWEALTKIENWLTDIEESLEKEQHLTKRNKLFDECVANCDPATMKEVSDNIDKMLEKEQPKRKLRKVCNLREDLKDDKPLEERLEELRQIRTEKDRLDEAADEYVKDDALKPWRNLCKEAFIAGAKWQAEQGKIFDTILSVDNYTEKPIVEGLPDGFHTGDKVRVQITKI